MEAVSCLDRWQHWWTPVFNKHIEVEKVLESDELMLQGRCDCLIRGEAEDNVLYDWKTSDTCYTNDYLEVCAYAGLLAKQGVIVAKANIVRVPKAVVGSIQVITLTTEQLVHGWGIFRVLLNAKRAFDEYEKILKGGAGK